MRIPIGSSKSYKMLGRTKAVYSDGCVLFLTPSEYNLVMPHKNALHLRDATTDEINIYDEQCQIIQDAYDEEWEKLVTELAQLSN